MKTSRKGFVKIIILLVILIVILILAFFFFSKKTIAPGEVSVTGTSTLPRTVNTTTAKPTTPTVQNSAKEVDIIKKLKDSWLATQSRFTIKSGERGSYSLPNKIQFISPMTILVNYNDGSRDYISILYFENNAFTEIKSVGLMSTVPIGQWKTYVAAYGEPQYNVSNYTSSDGKLYTKVVGNIFAADEITAKLKETSVSVDGISITPKVLVQDNRCPEDANCIVEGTVNLKVYVEPKGKKPIEYAFELGKATQTTSGLITFTSAVPSKAIGVNIKPEEYVFTFKIALK